MADALVESRLKALDLLHRVFDGKAFWMNTAALSGKELAAASSRALDDRALLSLGLSAGKLLCLPAGVTMVRACAQLLMEFEHHFFPGLKQDLKLLGLRSAPDDYYPDTCSGVGDLEPIKPVIHRAGGQVKYEHLVVFPRMNPGQLDFVETTCCMLDTLTQVYRKFVDVSCSAPGVFEALSRVDSKLRKLVLKPLAEELSAACGVAISTRTASVGALVGLAPAS